MKQDINLHGRTLVVLSPAFAPDESSGQSPWLPAQQALIRCIKRNFPALEIIILPFQFPVSKAEYIWHGNRVIPFGGANKKGMHNMLLWLKVFGTLRKLRSQKNILGIISFWCTECCLVGSYFSRVYGIKHICWISGQDAKKENKLVKRIRPNAGELAAMSDFLMDEFYKNHGTRPQYLIPDAIDTSLFANQQFSRTVGILGVGNLIPLKQYNVFVEVVGAVAAEFTSLHAVLCGGGTEEQNLKTQVSAAGLENVVQFTGVLAHNEVLALMQKTKIFLHTSNYEGFGNVCIEALYAGAHVISFTRPMKQDIPHWHIAPGKDEMIAKALEILRDEQTTYSPVLPFDMNDSAKKFIEILTRE